MQEFVLKFRDEPDKFEAQFPGPRLSAALPLYVALKSGSKKIFCARATSRPRAFDNEVWLSRSAPVRRVEQASVTFEAISEHQFRRFCLFHEPSRYFGFVGFLFLVLAAIFSGSLAVGEVWAVIIVPKHLIVVTVWAALVSNVAALAAYSLRDYWK